MMRGNTHEDILLTTINNILKNIKLNINGKETNLKNLNEEIFGLENFTKNLNSKLEIINKIFSKNQIPKIKIEEFRDLILLRLFMNTKFISNNIISDNIDYKNNPKYFSTKFKPENDNIIIDLISKISFYIENEVSYSELLINDIFSLLNDNQKKEFNQDIEYLKETKKEKNYIDYQLDEINEELNILCHSNEVNNREINKFNNLEYNLSQKLININEKEIQFIQRKLIIEKMFDRLNENQKEKFNQDLKYLKEIRILIDEKQKFLIFKKYLLSLNYKDNFYEKSIIDRVISINDNELNKDYIRILYEDLEILYKEYIDKNINLKIIKDVLKNYIDLYKKNHIEKEMIKNEFIKQNQHNQGLILGCINIFSRKNISSERQIINKVSKKLDDILKKICKKLSNIEYSSMFNNIDNIFYEKNEIKLVENYKKKKVTFNEEVKMRKIFIFDIIKISDKNTFLNFNDS